MIDNYYIFIFIDQKNITESLKIPIPYACNHIIMFQIKIKLKI